MKRKSYIFKRCLFAFNVVFLALLSLSFAFMPFSTRDESSKTLVIATGLLFWLGLLGTIILALLINHFRRSDVAFNKAAKKYKRFALTHFFQTFPGMIFDILLILSTIAFIVVIAINLSLSIKFILISVIIFSFGMHCMLNGINFVYVMNKRIRRVKKHEEC